MFNNRFVLPVLLVFTLLTPVGFSQPAQPITHESGSSTSPDMTVPSSRVLAIDHWQTLCNAQTEIRADLVEAVACSPHGLLGGDRSDSGKSLRLTGDQATQSARASSQ